MKIVLCGIQQQGIEIIKFLSKNGIEVTNIVTIRQDMADGTWVSYEELGIPIYYAKTYKLSHDEDIKYFTTNKFDLLLLGGWQRLISDTILNTLTLGGIGQHGSPEFLPKGRGRSPLNWSIILGKKRLIWNLFLLKPGIDDGDVIDYEIFEINEFDDCKTLYYKVETSVKHMLLRTIPKFSNGTLKRIKQSGSPTYFDKRKPSDGEINWNYSVFDISNLIRAVTNPYPGAFTIYDNEKIYIWKAQLWDTMFDYYRESDYGEVVEVFNDDFVVKCPDGLLLIRDHTDNNVFVGKKYKNEE